MESLSVGIVMFSRAISGGANIIFNYCLNAPPHTRVTIIYVDRPEESDTPAWHAALTAPRIRWLTVRQAAAERFDVLVFTYFETIYLADQLEADRCVYFVQSIESRFTPESPVDAMRAEITYTPKMGYITVASWIARYLHEVHHQTAVIVRNGIDKSLFRSDGPCLEERTGRLRVVVEGSLGARFKRVPETLELLRGLADVEIWLLTPSPIAADDLADRVLSGIPIADVPAVLRSCDVLLKLSTVEGMFGPPLEMFHCGGTAITSNVTGHEEYIRHRVNALVVPTRTIGRARDYVELLSSVKSFAEKLKSGAAQTAMAWPSVEDSAAEFWAAMHVAREQSQVSTERLAAYLRTHRLLVRARRFQAPQEVPAAMGGRPSIRTALDAAIAEVNRGGAGAGNVFADLRAALSDLGITPDDALALQGFIRRNYDEGSPSFQLAWHVLEYMYVYAMHALNNEGSAEVAAFWFGGVVDIVTDFSMVSTAVPPRAFLLPMALYHLALSDFYAGRDQAAFDALQRLWRHAVRPEFSDRFSESDKAVAMSVQLAENLVRRQVDHNRVFLAALQVAFPVEPSRTSTEEATATLFVAVARAYGTMASQEPSVTNPRDRQLEHFLKEIEEAVAQPELFSLLPVDIAQECFAHLRQVPNELRSRLSALLRHCNSYDS